MSTASTSRGLGKGLQALMSESYSRGVGAVSGTDVVQQITGNDAVRHLPLEALNAGKYQPRRHFSEEELHELAASIQAHGILQPLTVRAINNGYEIVAGERRWRAARIAKLKEVPVILREITDAQALELGLVENIQRKDLNPLEEGEGYRRLIEEFHYTQEKLANIVGKSRSHVANLLRLESLPPQIKRYIDTGELTMGHARAILAARDPLALAEKIIAVGMTVRRAEELVRVENDPTQAQPPRTTQRTPQPSRKAIDKSEDVLQLEAMLSENLGLNVSIHQHGAKAGEVVIAYSTLNELDAVLKRLGGGL